MLVILSRGARVQKNELKSAGTKTKIVGVTSKSNFSFLVDVILSFPVGVGWVVVEFRNKTKLQPSSVEVELGLSLAIHRIVLKSTLDFLNLGFF